MPKRPVRTPGPGPAEGAGNDELEALVGALESGVLRLRDGRVDGCNRAFAGMIGRSEAALGGLEVAAVLADPAGGPLPAPKDGPAALRSADGSLRPVTLRAVGHGLWLVIDRARETRLEAEVWSLSRGAQPGASHEPLRNEIAGLIEHEIGTAATVLRGYLHMLADPKIGALEEPHLGWVREASRAADRISALSDNLLCVASAGADALALDSKRLALREPVESAIAAAAPFLRHRAVSVALEVAPGIDDTVVGDVDRLEQVVLNLLHNACKHAPRGTGIAVSIDGVELEHGSEVTISVADAGPGVTADEAGRIFAAFVQARAPGKSSEGVGLGLAVCRHITERHGGRIQAVPDLGSGLFRVTLPVARDGRE